MVLVKATKNSESGAPPSPETLEMITAMGRFNEELEHAGVLLAADGLQPSSKGARVTFSGIRRTVTDGPFAETKELVAGFWIWKCDSLQEAIEWAKRCPNPMPGEESDIEIRPIHEFDEFLAEFAPDLRKEMETTDGQAPE
ncbi:YciI family protein [Luteolibacter yonseiensis]|uniref:YciI family protein n=2 Tax=Luteolibacter yonseiensis TaxID=1144680 RepID=A0A934VD54_9BACT|nr:YciI family protein [Luteolibacter yonseiensis]MBK1817790.1 YciI family protein [Luteolibacter yonseiensis]